MINPLNLRLAGKELQFILADSGTEVVFVDAMFAEHFVGNIAEIRDSLALRHVVLIGEATCLTTSGTRSSQHRERCHARRAG